MKEAKRYRAIKPWIPKYPYPLTLKKGDIVRVDRDDNEYKGFAWCEHWGWNGWVPLEIIELIDDNRVL